MHACEVDAADESDPDIFEDEVFQVDVIVRLPHGIEHRGKCLPTIAQQSHLVPSGQRTFRQHLLHDEPAPKDVGAAPIGAQTDRVGRSQIVIRIGHGSAGCQRHSACILWLLHSF
jgi:hypothetical protein